MGLEELFEEFRVPPRIRQVQRFLSNCKYDNSSITYDENGEIVSVKRRSAKEVEREQKCTCLDALFYAGWKLRDSYPPRVISLAPVIIYEKDNPELQKAGYWHGIMPFKSRGKIGAIGKSRISNLEFQPPIYDSEHELIFANPQIREGLKQLQDNRSLPFIGIVSKNSELLSNEHSRYVNEVKVNKRPVEVPYSVAIALFNK